MKNNNSNKNRTVRFGFSGGALSILVLIFGWAAYAKQSGAPVDLTSTAKITPTADGFQVDFPSPVNLGEIVYDGDYQGPFEVQTPATDGATQEAYALIDKALESKPDDPTLLDTKGLIHMKNGRPQDAIPLMERAVELTCEGPIYVLHLAFAQMKNGDNDKAVTTFEKVRPVLMTRTNLLLRDNKSMFDEMEMKLGGPSL